MKRLFLVLSIGLGLLASSAWATGTKDVYCLEDGGSGKDDGHYTVETSSSSYYLSSDQFKCTWAKEDYPTETIDDNSSARIKIYCENADSDSTYVPAGISCRCAEKVSCATPESPIRSAKVICDS